MKKLSTLAIVALSVLTIGSFGKLALANDSNRGEDRRVETRSDRGGENRGREVNEINDDRSVDTNNPNEVNDDKGVDASDLNDDNGGLQG
jgi:hypothetical protein